MTGNSPPVYNGRYELSHQIARGGTAQVYLARDLLLDRPVALKVLFPELSTDHSFVERFRREAQAAANLSHPNIVPVFDWGESDRTYYIVMEYVDGEPLSAVLKAQGPIDPAQAAAVAADIAKALSYAHRHGVVHRDIKPGNVLITVDGEVKVTDFGIARAIGTEENITQTGLVMGTATYFSPEQAQGLGVDGRSDIYSLGVVLFESVTGRPPFTGETPVSIAYQHVREIAPTPRSIKPDVPPELEAVILKAMAKQPSDRYTTAQDFQEDLKLFVQGGTPLAAQPEKPAVVTPPPPAERPTIVTPRGAAATTVLAAAAPEEALVVSRPPETRTQYTGASAAVPAVNGQDSGVNVATSKNVSGAPPLPKTRTPHWLAAALALLLAIGAIVVIGGRQLGYFGAQPWFGMPQVKGAQLTSAKSVLSADGLNLVQNYQFSTMPKGQVLSQSPSTGTLVQKGVHVTLVVSNGYPSKQVPNVIGLSKAKAKAALQAKGFTDIISTNAVPPAGSAVKTVGDVWNQLPVSSSGPYSTGNAVTIFIVIPPATATIPTNIVGLSYTAAEGVLTQLGFTLANPPVSLNQQPSTTVQAGEVAATQPPVGSTEKRGTPVQLIISSGPPPQPVIVPNVQGETLQKAEGDLNLAGFTSLTSGTTVVCSKSQDGLVQYTNPSEGSSEPKTQLITITVGQFNSSAPQCATTTTSTTSTTQPNTGGSGNSGALGGL